MKQILQMLRTRETVVSDGPEPALRRGHVLVRSELSLVSAGTERMLVDFSRAGYLQKALQQPDKVRDVFDKIKVDGLIPTIEAVQSKLDEPLPMGYSNVGRIVKVGADAGEFGVGDRVLSNGYHAEVVCVGKNLCAKVPDGLLNDDAVFGVVGSIALQSIRLVQPSTGECFVVIGLGLIGLMTVQILRASGCRVLGMDFDESKLKIARSYGAQAVNPERDEDILSVANAFSRGRGVDGVVIAASTESNETIQQAAHMCRKRGRIVLVGVVGLQLNRADFYEKELSFQVSCSYGPGRYDPDYEQRGVDYPVGFVRWTEQRNFEAVLDLLESGQINVDQLKSATFDIDDASDAYDLLVSDRSALGILINYPHSPAGGESRRRQLTGMPTATPVQPRKGVIGAIGAGNYAGRILLPSFARAGAQLRTIVSSQGVSGSHIGKKLGFNVSSTDTSDVFDNKDIDTVIVATQHDSHAEYAVKALEMDKHVFVEKPLCLSLEDLEHIEATITERPGLKIMVGFNRRFSRLVVKMKELLSGISGPKSFIMMVNAGEVPGQHWTQNMEIGGGRIVGEACHFIDLIRHLANSAITSHSVTKLADNDGGKMTSDKVSIALSLADGSFGVVHYLANGHKAFPKERLEVFCGGRVLQLDNFRRLKGWGWQGFSSMRLWRQDKGQIACAASFIDAVRNGDPAPIPLDEILEVSRVSIEAQDALS